MAAEPGGSRDRAVGLGRQGDGNQQRLAAAGLVAVALVWGSTFSAVKDAVASMPAADFLAIRFTLAAVILIAVRPASLGQATRLTLRHGLVLGVLLAIAYLAQTVGLERIDAGVSGVLTGLLVVLAPLVAAVTLRRSVGARVWTALALGALGSGVLALANSGFGVGEGLTLLSALVLAGHLVAFAAVADAHNLWTLTVIQLLTAATLSAALAAPGGITAPPNLGVWGDVLLAAVLATVVAAMVQAWAQRRLAPARVGVLLATEPVFAVLVAVWLLNEVLSWQLVLGGSLIVAAMVTVELGSTSPGDPAGDLPDR